MVHKLQSCGYEYGVMLKCVQLIKIVKLNENKLIYSKCFFMLFPVFNISSNYIMFIKSLMVFNFN